jgi:diketogulonate reductase-like aldo/keto reductase
MWLGVFVVAFFQCCSSRIAWASSKEITDDHQHQEQIREKMVDETNVPTAVLSNGIRIPLVGLGCASGVRKSHVISALEAGYRFLDTAQSYNWGYHEDEVGAAANEFFENHRDSSEEEDEDDDVPNGIFLQTKIHPEDLGYEATKRAVKLSLSRLQVEYIDSVLIHKPRCWEGACRKQPEGTWQDSWKALEEFYEAGVVRAIGICDVDDRLFQELLAETNIPPHIIQNWMDPMHQDVHMRERCKKSGIQYQAYSTLGTQWVHHRGIKENPVLNNPTLLALAEKYHVHVAQIVIHWATRHGVSVLPASTNPQRQQHNLVESFTFDLTIEEMASIDALDGKVPKGERPDPNLIRIQFENQAENGAIEAYWVNTAASGGEEEQVLVGTIEEGESLEFNTFHGHQFVFKDAESGMNVGEHLVSRGDGKEQSHAIGGRSEL